MTKMLASVRDVKEAAMVAAAGVDLIDCKDPSQGALGALPPGAVADIVNALGAGCIASAIVGDLEMDPALLVQRAQAMAATGVFYVKIGFFADVRSHDCARALSTLAHDHALIAVLFGDMPLDLSLLPVLAQSGFAGAMLDTARKGHGRLLDHQDMAQIGAFADLCRAHGLMVGCAGSLEAPDIPRLLLAKPDFLGFRGALCQQHDRTAGLDSAAIAMIRTLIPAEHGGTAVAQTRQVDERLLSARGYCRDQADQNGPTDRVFVHDLVLPVQIGAYDFEHGITQKVRFNVDVDVARNMRGGDDIGSVFSYDIIIDAIKMLLQRGHVAMVETLAEEISQGLLQHARVVCTHVRVEKLDVIAGTVGVAIVRHRAMRGAKVQELFPNLDVSTK